MIRLFAVITACFVATASIAGDKYVGYYYPELTSEETFDRVIRPPQNAGKDVRIDFVNQLTLAQLKAPENPRFAVFAKGNDASKLILTALDDEVFASIYRARAILAQLTVSVRQGGLFRQQDLQYVVTFFDLLQMMEFDELIVTDGETWTHKVAFKR